MTPKSARAFEPFFTTKEPAAARLGLSTVRRRQAERRLYLARSQRGGNGAPHLSAARQERALSEVPPRAQSPCARHRDGAAVEMRGVRI